MKEYKTVPFELTKLDSNGRTFEGYASVFRSPDKDKADLTGDMVMAGAFKKTLVERGSKVRMLYQHDPSQPIGKWTELREDDKGLFVKGVISQTRLGLDCLQLLRDKAIDSMSIGYDALPGGTDYVKGANGQPLRLLRDVRLWEVSLVTFPADEQARVLALKAATGAQAFKAAGFAATFRELLSQQDLWETQMKIEGAFHASLDSILSDESLDGKAKLSMIGDSLKEYSEALSDWAARVIAVSGKSAGEPAECKAGRRHSSATRAAIQTAIKVLNDLIEEAGGEPDQAACNPDDDERKPRKDDEKSTDIDTPVEPAPSETQDTAGGDSAKAGPDATPPTAEAAAGPGDDPPTPSQSGDPVLADLDREMEAIRTVLLEAAQ